MNDYEEVEGNVAEIVGQPKPTEHALAGIVTGEHVPLHVIRFARVKSKYIYTTKLKLSGYEIFSTFFVIYPHKLL